MKWLLVTLVFAGIASGQATTAPATAPTAGSPGVRPTTRPALKTPPPGTVETKLSDFVAANPSATATADKMRHFRPTVGMTEKQVDYMLAVQSGEGAGVRVQRRTVEEVEGERAISYTLLQPEKGRAALDVLVPTEFVVVVDARGEVLRVRNLGPPADFQADTVDAPSLLRYFQRVGADPAP